MVLKFFVRIDMEFVGQGSAFQDAVEESRPVRFPTYLPVFTSMATSASVWLMTR